MLNQRIKTLFDDYDPAIRNLVYEVTELEQRFISMKNPRGIHNEIDEIVTRIAKQELESSQSATSKD